MMLNFPIFLYLILNFMFTNHAPVEIQAHCLSSIGFFLQLIELVYFFGA